MQDKGIWSDYHLGEMKLKHTIQWEILSLWDIPWFEQMNMSSFACAVGTFLSLVLVVLCLKANVSQFAHDIEIDINYPKRIKVMSKSLAKIKLGIESLSLFVT